MKAVVLNHVSVFGFDENFVSFFISVQMKVLKARSCSSYGGILMTSIIWKLTVSIHKKFNLMKKFNL